MKIRRHAPNVYVIKTDEPEELRRFFEALGLSFQDEKHGNGPEHVSCERNGQVLEIYPETGHEAAAPVTPGSAEPEFDPRPLFMETGCEGRHFVHACPTPHTFPGRIRAWCPVKRVVYNFSKAQMLDAPHETMLWLDGYLAGNEPEPPRHEEGFAEYTSPAALAWADKAKAFRSKGFWPGDESPP